MNFYRPLAWIAVSLLTVLAGAPVVHAAEELSGIVKSVDVDANHYGVITHPRTADAIRSFLS